MKSCFPVVALLVFASCASQKPSAQRVVTSKGPLSEVETRIIGARPLQTIQFQDGNGKYVLALRRRTRGSDQNEKEDEIRLFAMLFQREEGGKGLRKRWEIKEVVDCPGLDLSADFVTSATSVTDLNGDGQAEVTVAYKTFCGGGVDPQTIVIIMHDRDKQYAIRGESLIIMNGVPPYGGQRQPSPAFASAPKEFKDYLEQIWQSIYIQRY